MTEDTDTICAVSTPAGIAGIAIIRLSGPATPRIISEIFRPNRRRTAPQKSHTVRYGHIVEDDRILDEVLVTRMAAPRSYTREEMAEIGCHGGIAATRQVLSACVRHGARPARPGEFTMRAFLNGRIDLAQAESVLQIVHSQTTEALAASVAALTGQVSRRLAALREAIRSLRAVVEAGIEFPDENLSQGDASAFRLRLKEALAQVNALRDEGHRGRLCADGVKAAIVGRVNVGKSSLLNALLREDRALVTEIPGTTRDAIEETIAVRGVPVRIIDTAGIRRVRGTVERMGVRKALWWMRRADITLLVLDGSRPLSEYDRRLIRASRRRACLYVVNKADLPRKLRLPSAWRLPDGQICEVSALTGKGIAELEEKLHACAVGQNTAASGAVFLSVRQDDLLRRCAEEIAEALKEDAPDECAAEHLKAAARYLDEVSGKSVRADVLADIFSRFCVGK